MDKADIKLLEIGKGDAFYSGTLELEEVPNPTLM